MNLTETGIKTILDLFTFDLSTFFLEEDYEEISCIEEAGVFMIEYQKKLPWLELNLFDQVIFRVFNDKDNIVGSSHINVDFPVGLNPINKDHLVELVNSITKLYGRDDENQGAWNVKDDENFDEQLVERFWTRGEGKNIYTIKLTYTHSAGLTFKILFFNHLLNLTHNN